MINIYGNKGSRLLDIKALGISTPEFVIIPSDKVYSYTDNYLHDLIKILEHNINGIFGQDFSVSVRSSSSVIMPGIMETILNVSSFDELNDAIHIIIQSAMSKKCLWYKNTFGLDNNIPFGIIIQKMVFGDNDSHNSGSGVYITQNPFTGDIEYPYGEFQFGVIGQQIVGGICNPQYLFNDNPHIHCLKNDIPHCYELLLKYGKMLELHYKMVQEIEFTIENGNLYILQTRDATISVNAAKIILKNLINSNVIHDTNDINKFKNIYSINDINENSICINNDYVLISKGFNSSGGVAYGYALICNSINTNLTQCITNNNSSILIVRDTTPSMLPIIHQCNGCLTKYGGTLCHASIVCRALNKSAVTGCDSIVFIDETTIKIDNYVIHNGDSIAIDGNTGNIYLHKQHIN